MKLMSTSALPAWCGALLLALFAPLVLAESVAAKAKDPRQLVEGITQELFAQVREQKAKKTSDDAYFAQVKGTLEEVVNFPYIAANVMGKQAYDQASAAQRQQFLGVFRDGLVKSYAKGISGYADSEVKVVGVVPDARNDKRVTVNQEVDDKGTVHKLDYTLIQNKGGEWKLVNVTLNGVNLGMSFAGQFKAAMRKHSNDLDKVIASWLADA